MSRPSSATATHNPMTPSTVPAPPRKITNVHSSYKNQNPSPAGATAVAPFSSTSVDASAGPCRLTAPPRRQQAPTRMVPRRRPPTLSRTEAWCRREARAAALVPFAEPASRARPQPPAAVRAPAGEQVQRAPRSYPPRRGAPLRRKEGASPPPHARARPAPVRRRLRFWGRFARGLGAEGGLGLWCGDGI